MCLRLGQGFAEGWLPRGQSFHRLSLISYFLIQQSSRWTNFGASLKSLKFHVDFENLWLGGIRHLITPRKATANSKVVEHTLVRSTVNYFRISCLLPPLERNASCRVVAIGTMSPAQSTSTDLLGYHFLRLPRELRDLIYPYIVIEDTPIHLSRTAWHLKITNPIVFAEYLEAVYTHNTVIVTFSDPIHIRYGTTPGSIWGLHPQFKQYIRHLVVETTEARLHETKLLQLERECTVTNPEVRKEWTELLELPRLEDLTINMQKYSASQFAWANFSPILYQLRDNLPKLTITFNISYDRLLEIYWHDTVWPQSENTTEDDYEEMGYVEVSELIAAPSAEDKDYVEMYMKNEIRTKGIDAIEGMLSESAANRRVLGPHYVVKEPALLRVLMEEHWQVYKKFREEKASHETPDC